MKPDTKALVESFIRTISGYIVGWLVVAAVRLGVEIDTVAAIAVVQPVVGGLVYMLIRVLETKVSPRFGWLLGLAKAPSYTKAP